MPSDLIRRQGLPGSGIEQVQLTIVDGERDRIALGGAEVTETAFFGTYHQCSARLAGLEEPVRLRLPQKRMVEPGETLEIYGEPADMVLLTR